jgi:hypothetical protein
LRESHPEYEPPSVFLGPEKGSGFELGGFGPVAGVGRAYLHGEAFEEFRRKSTGRARHQLGRAYGFYLLVVLAVVVIGVGAGLVSVLL